jgi:hypothetical protein
LRFISVLKKAGMLRIKGNYNRNFEGICKSVLSGKLFLHSFKLNFFICK